MPESGTIEADQNLVAADCKTGAEAEAPEIPRRRGRPLGSRNKVSREARALLAAGGHKAITTLLRIASGQSVPGEAKENGGREKVYPSIEHQMAASRIVLGRLIPELKAQEISGPDGEPLTVPVEASSRDIAKAVLATLSNGIPQGGRVTVETPDTFTARFTDKELGERIMGNGTVGRILPADASAAGGDSSALPAAALGGSLADELGRDASPESPEAKAAGYSRLCADGQCRIIRSLQHGVLKWGAYREADRSLLRFVDSEEAGVEWAEQRLKEKGFV